MQQVREDTVQFVQGWRLNLQGFVKGHGWLRGDVEEEVTAIQGQLMLANDKEGQTATLTNLR